ncbi:hypothetical protein NDU88_006666 [Pleurodeles waltl]|uniref:Uncharacterized protein n=1 Tax=Pleurodeles waltl TaxID=8319 RepID=A0AAV7P001_PLEWA|nr:hypothetical protein NDU88_006666 [Pleurodeles waltl]
MVRDKAAGIPAQQQMIDKYAKQNVSGSEIGVVGGTHEPECTTQTPTILQAISDLKVAIKGKMGELKVDLAVIRQDLRNTTHYVTEVEGHLSEKEDTVKSQGQRLAILQWLVNQLVAKAENGEGRSRRNNLRVVVIPECAVAATPTKSMWDWLMS